jgi:hypothetical protein
MAAGAAAVAAGAIAAGVFAGTQSASADTTSTATPSSSASTGAQTRSGSGAPADGAQSRPDRHRSSPVRDDEKSLSTEDAAKVKAAALDAVSGGTVYRVETDAGDATYEAHMTKADGTEVTVKLDENFTVTGLEDGMGKGDPAPAGAPASDHARSGEAPSGDGSTAPSPSA